MAILFQWTRRLREFIGAGRFRRCSSAIAVAVLDAAPAGCTSRSIDDGDGGETTGQKTALRGEW
jgi:hypothetical protein